MSDVAIQGLFNNSSYASLPRPLFCLGWYEFITDLSRFDSLRPATQLSYS